MRSCGVKKETGGRGASGLASPKISAIEIQTEKATTQKGVPFANRGEIGYMLRRLRTVLSHVARSKPTSPALVQHRVQWSLQRNMASGRVSALARDPRTVAIGDVSVDVTPGDPRLVPRGRLDGSEHFTTSSKPTALSQDVLTHLRWMMQKDGLGQDMFLVGPPGPRRRQLAMLYCELVSREYEFVSITRDTTESDLKQRREIVGGSSVHSDQAPVRAALEGRILILEGIEKAERNVLPTLNNLLENREMALDDGRFLMRYGCCWGLMCSSNRLRWHLLLILHVCVCKLSTVLSVCPVPVIMVFCACHDVVVLYVSSN